MGIVISMISLGIEEAGPLAGNKGGGTRSSIVIVSSYCTYCSPAVYSDARKDGTCQDSSGEQILYWIMMIGFYYGTGQSCRPTIVRLDRFPYTPIDRHAPTDTRFPATRPVQQQDRAIHSHLAPSTRSLTTAHRVSHRRKPCPSLASPILSPPTPSRLRYCIESGGIINIDHRPSTIIHQPSHRPSGILLQQNEPDRGGCNVCWAESRGCTRHPIWPLTID